MSFHNHLFKETHFNIFRPCNPQSKIIIQHNPNQTASVCHNMLISTPVNSPWLGCWVAGPARWPGPRAGGPCGRQHDGPCVPSAGHSTDRHTLIQGRPLCVSVRDRKKNGVKELCLPRQPCRSVVNTPLPIFCADSPPCKHGVALHKLRCWHWSVERINQTQRPWLLIINVAYLSIS